MTRPSPATDADKRLTSNTESSPPTTDKITTDYTEMQNYKPLQTTIQTPEATLSGLSDWVARMELDEVEQN